MIADNALRDRRNRDAARERSKRWEERNPDRRREISRRRQLKRRNVTQEQYDAMVARYDNRCAICRCDEPGHGNAHWNIDHCHGTNVVRGLLCHDCNLGLGKFKDSPELLQAATEYLCQTKHNSTPPTLQTAGPMKASQPTALNAKPRTSYKVATSSQNFVGRSRRCA